jgi:hypothetical protein
VEEVESEWDSVRRTATSSSSAVEWSLRDEIEEEEEAEEEEVSSLAAASEASGDHLWLPRSTHRLQAPQVFAAGSTWTISATRTHLARAMLL